MSLPKYTATDYLAMTARVLFIVASLLLGMTLGQTAQSQVIFSEIMYNPNGTDVDAGSFNKEWVELYNTGTTSVDLSGWIFEDSQDMTPANPIPNGTFLGAGETLVLVGDAQRFDLHWGTGINRLELGNFPTLANSPSSTNEILSLRNNANTVIDQVNYDDANGWPSDSPDGPSIFALPGGLTPLANNDGSNWRRSNFGVYGAAHDQFGDLDSMASPGFVANQTTSFSPSPDAAWSMVFFPDTQNYVKSQTEQPALVGMAQWVHDNRAAWNIQLLLQGGDIVNKNSNESPASGENASTLQWQNAQSAISVLNGKVPYIMSAGNHDFGTNNAENRNTRLNDFFQASDNSLVDPAQGGILQGFFEPGKLENAYYELTAPDGREMVIFSLEWGPRQQVVNWANQIAGQAKFADHTAVLLTHAYMYHDGARHDWNRNLDADPNNDQGGNPHDADVYDTANDPDGTHDGEELWNELVKQQGNFELVFNGHIGGDGTGNLASTADAGNEVQQMGFNSQFETNGGNGWIRVLEFMEDGRTVRVRTYSPLLDFVRTNPENEFFFELEPLRPADFDGDGDVDGADLAEWRLGFASTEANWTDGDADGDADVDGSDFLRWQRGFPPVSGSQSTTSSNVPEPTTCSLAILSLLGYFFLAWRRDTFRLICVR